MFYLVQYGCVEGKSLAYQGSWEQVSQKKKSWEERGILSNAYQGEMPAHIRKGKLYKIVK